MSTDTTKHWEKRMALHVVSYEMKFGSYHSLAVWSWASYFKESPTSSEEKGNNHIIVDISLCLPRYQPPNLFEVLGTEMRVSHMLGILVSLLLM